MNTKKRSNLGRGLSALLGGDEPGAAAPGAVATAAAGQQGLPLQVMHPGRYQPRRHMDAEAIDALAQSIAEKGVLQPILVRPHPEKQNHYEIIAGERRWRAAQKAMLHEVPVIVRELNDAEALEIGLIENLQREDLTPIEEAEGFRRLMDEFGHTQEKLAEHLGKSRSAVANALRLLSLPKPVQGMLDEGTLSAGHVRPLIGRDDAEGLAFRIASEGLSVRQAEALAKSDSGGGKKPRKAPEKDADTKALERDLGSVLGLDVEIKTAGAGGALILRYKTLDQLDELLRRLSHGHN